jgi:DNA-binding transcriptional regulator YiaG
MTAAEFHAWRTSRGFTVPGLAAHWRVHRRTIERWENQKNAVSKIVAYACAAYDAGVR